MPYDRSKPLRKRHVKIPKVPEETANVALPTGRKMVRELVERGLSVEDVAYRLKLKVEVVSRVVATEFARSEQDPLSDVSTSIRVDVSRLNRAMDAIWDQVLKGNLDAIKTMVLLMDRRAKFLGVDGGVDSVPIAEVQRLMAAYAQGYKIVVGELFKQGNLIGVGPEEAQQRMRDHVVRIARNDDRSLPGPKRGKDQE